MFLLYVVLGVVLGTALIAVSSILNQPQCYIVFTGHSTVIQGCTNLHNLEAVIEALNHRLS